MVTFTSTSLNAINTTFFLSDKNKLYAYGQGIVDILNGDETNNGESIRLNPGLAS